MPVSGTARKASTLSILRSIVDRAPPLANIVRNLRDDRAFKAMSLQDVPGHDLRIWGGSWLAAGHYEDQGRFHEMQEIELFSRVLATVEMLIDVGANNGLFSLVAASKGLSVLAVEPMLANVAMLGRNLRENDLEARVEVFQVAASHRVGLADMYGRGQMASLITNWNKNPTFDKKLVPTNTLDNLFAARTAGRSFAMKVDVEGAELAALSGARKLLAQKPYVLIENCLNFEQQEEGVTSFVRVFDMFWKEGYTAIVADDTRAAVNSSIAARWVENKRVDAKTVNFLMIPPGGSAH